MAEPLIHVVDDDAALRASVAFLLESVGWEVTCHPDARSFLATVDRSRPGCALLDLRMPMMSGLELQRAMADSGIELPVIFLTGHGDVAVAVQAMKNGAIDMLEKPFHDQALLDAVSRAVTLCIATRQSDARRQAVHQRFEQLTSREREVARLVGRGLPNKLVARALSISEKTVHIHRAHVMDKLDVHSAAELALLLTSLDPGFAAEPDPLGKDGPAGLRHPHASLPEVRRRGGEDHPGHARAAGDREDPDAAGP